MSKLYFTETENWAVLRASAKLTLVEVSKATGYGVATINGLEKNNHGSVRLKEALRKLYGLSDDTLKEDTKAYQVIDWRDRAVRAESKLAQLQERLAEIVKEFSSESKTSSKTTSKKS